MARKANVQYRQSGGVASGDGNVMVGVLDGDNVEGHEGATEVK